MNSNVKTLNLELRPGSLAYYYGRYKCSHSVSLVNGKCFVYNHYSHFQIKSALNSIIPLYVWNTEFLEGFLAVCMKNVLDCMVYVTKYLAKPAWILEMMTSLCLYCTTDKKTHLYLTLTEWAKKWRVILLVLLKYTINFNHLLAVALFAT